MKSTTIQLNMLKNGNENGKSVYSFRKGHKAGQKKLGTIDLTYRLRNLLLDSLMEENLAGDPVVVDAIKRCMQNKPEQILALATRMLPKDININDGKIAFAPLVVVNNTNIQINKENPLEKKDKDERTVDAISFSRPVLIPDPIDNSPKETMGSFTKEDFINARTDNGNI